MGLMGTFRASRRIPVLQVLKASVATIAAWLITSWLMPGPLPIFAAIAALLVVQPSVNQSFGKAIERSIGVILGVIVATALSLAFGEHAWVVLVAIVAAMLIAWGLKMTPGTSNQVAISAILVLALGAASPEYSLQRIVETLIGAVIGIVVNALIVPPVAVAPARRDLALLGGELAASLDRLADRARVAAVARAGAGAAARGRLMRPMRDAADASIADGEESLTLNPRRSAHRTELAEMRALLDRLSPIVTQVIGMTRAFFDHYDAALADGTHRAGHRRAVAPGVPRRAPRRASRRRRTRAAHLGDPGADRAARGAAAEDGATGSSSARSWRTCVASARNC